MVRVLTDGEDTEHRYTLDKILDEFPDVDGKNIRANLVLLGDLEIPVKKARAGFEIVSNPQWDLLTPPVILWAPQPVRVNEEISFFDNSRSSYKFFEWRIDGNPVGRDKVLKHRFNRSGDHEVSLTVTGEGGARDTSRASLKVLELEKPEPLTIDFVFTPAQPEVDEPVRFLGRTSGKATSHSWLVGDKEFGTQLDAEQKFAAEGTYEIRFVCKDATGEKTEKSKFVVIREPLLTVSFKAPTEVFSGQTLQFVNETEGKAVRFEWDFGDGTTSNERNPTKAYTHSGDSPATFQVSLSAFTPTGRAFKSQPTAIRVLAPVRIPTPKAAFRVLGEQFKVGKMIEFIDESQGLIESYRWRFDNEGTSSNKNPIFAFASPGSRLVQLTVSGPGGSSDSSINLDVLKPPLSITVKWFDKHGTETLPKEIDFGSVAEKILRAGDYSLPEFSSFTVIFPEDLPADAGMDLSLPAELNQAIEVFKVGAQAKMTAVSSGLQKEAGTVQYSLGLKKSAPEGTHIGKLVLSPSPKDGVLINGGQEALQVPLRVRLRPQGSLVLPMLFLFLAIFGVSVWAYFKVAHKPPLPMLITLKRLNPPGDSQAFKTHPGKTIDLGAPPAGVQNPLTFDVGAPAYFISLSSRGIELHQRKGGKPKLLKSGDTFILQDEAAVKKEIKLEAKPLPAENPPILSSRMKGKQRP